MSASATQGGHKQSKLNAFYLNPQYNRGRGLEVTRQLSTNQSWWSAQPLR